MLAQDQRQRDEFVLFLEFARENTTLKRRLNAIELTRTGKLVWLDGGWE